MTAGRLLTAAEGGDKDSVRALLDEGSDVEETDSYGNTALIFAAANGHVGIIRILLAAGADVNASRKDGMTPLILGTFSAHADVVRTLLAAGASLDATDSLGMTALQWAKSKGITEIEHILSDVGVVDAPPPAGTHEVEGPAVTDNVSGLRLGGLSIPLPIPRGPRQ
jgi:ankyrin repeat protein